MHQPHEAVVPERDLKHPRSLATTLLAPRAVLTPASPPALPGYAPGRLRSDSDVEHALVAAFTARYPEYSRLSHDELLQLAATYLSDADHETNARLRAEGVPTNWRPDLDPADDFLDVLTGAAFVGSDYR